MVAYESGKLVVQGKGTEDFVTNILEPEVTGEFLLGYEEVNHPEWFEPHAGLDESGKGDLFGPVVSACVIADGEMVKWMEQGIRDSKTITDGAIMKMAKSIASTKGVVVKTAFTGMEKYNELYRKFGDNLNKLLAWLHGKALNDAPALRNQNGDYSINSRNNHWCKNMLRIRILICKCEPRRRKIRWWRPRPSLPGQHGSNK